MSEEQRYSEQVLQEASRKLEALDPQAKEDILKF